MYLIIISLKNYKPLCKEVVRKLQLNIFTKQMKRCDMN